MTDIETVVIGAGVIGLATAAALAAKGHEVIVIEREPSIGQVISARNSEVIHAGIYYATGSKKATLCVRGKELLYQYCDERKIPHQRIGKLIVATNDKDIQTLIRLQQTAVSNGVLDTHMLEPAEAIDMQPGLNCIAALHSPSTGIIDSHSLMISLQADIETNNGMVVCNTEVQGIEQKNSAFDIMLEDGSTITAKNIVNCCGLAAVALAQKIKGLDPATIPEALFAKGNYFRLAAKAPFTKLIYPAPVPGGLGVHLTIDLGGQKRFGPDVEWLELQATNTTPFDYAVDPARVDSFYNEIRKYWPDLPDNSLVADYAGIRPKITRNGKQHVDFEFSTAQHHGVEGLVNLYGFESPGLTSSLAIAEQVSSYL